MRLPKPLDRVCAALAALGCLVCACTVQAQTSADAAAEFVAYAVSGDGIPSPFSPAAGDAARGRQIVAGRQSGLCLLCHSGPFPEERFQGNLAPDLAGAGQRLSAAQLRLRLVDSRRVNPQSLMPPYHSQDGLQQVGRAWQGRPLLNAQQIEDVVAYLLTLKDARGQQ